MKDIYGNNLKICIIISYFGKLPSTIDLWLKSCEYNSGINFLVYSDQEKNNLPKNVLWIKRSFSDFKALSEKKLNMKIQLDTPYECCDFKAVYGVIFDDYLKDYDYWGYCDMDMIFGDLEWFFNKYQLYCYDKFLSYGHLTLFRNTKENNERYKLPCTPGMGYKDAFTTKGSTHFCEMEINNIYKAYGFSYFDERICADISCAFNRMRLSGYYKDYKHQVFYYQYGKVWRAYRDRYTIGTWRGIETEEFAYIHFQKRKMPYPNFEINSSVKYYICSNGFVEKTDIKVPTIEDINKYNPYISKLVEVFELFKYKFPRVFSKLIK